MIAAGHVVSASETSQPKDFGLHAVARDNSYSRDDRRKLSLLLCDGARSVKGPPEGAVGRTYPLSVNGAHGICAIPHGQRVGNALYLDDRRRKVARTPHGTHRREEVEGRSLTSKSPFVRRVSSR